jgi:hypothetical protein
MCEQRTRLRADRRKRDCVPPRHRAGRARGSAPGRGSWGRTRGLTARGVSPPRRAERPAVASRSPLYPGRARRFRTGRVAPRHRAIRYHTVRNRNASEPGVTPDTVKTTPARGWQAGRGEPHPGRRAGATDARRVVTPPVPPGTVAPAAARAFGCLEAGNDLRHLAFTHCAPGLCLWSAGPRCRSPFS